MAAQTPTGLLDQFGNPLTRDFARVFKETQTEQAERMSFAGVGVGRRFSQGDGAKALTPARLNQALQSGMDGDLAMQSEVFAAMEGRDAHMYGEMNKRRTAPQTLPWQVNPPKGASKAKGESVVAAAMALLEHIPTFDALLFDLMDAVGHGFSATQLLWDYNGVEQYIKGAEHKPQSAFKLRKNCPPPGSRTDLRLMDSTLSTITNDFDGQDLWSFGWAVHIHRARSGFLGCSGLYRTLAWPYIYKHFATRDFAEFLEVYGLPMKIGTYPQGSTDSQKREYLRSLLQLGHNAAGVFPEGMAIDFKEAVAGKHDGFLSMIEYMDKAISKAVLGQTLSSGGEGGGSYALGMVHRQVQQDILMSDAKQLQGTITRDIIYPLLAVNGYIKNMAECPSFEFVIDTSEDLKGLADALPKLVNAGAQVPVAWVNKKFNIPMPVDGEAVLEKVVTGGFGGFGNASSTKPAALSASYALSGKPLQVALRAQAPVDDASQLADALSEQSKDAMAAMFSQINEVVASATSLQGLQDSLLRLYGDMDAAPLGDVMELAFATANLRGRWAVKQESKL